MRMALSHLGTLAAVRHVINIYIVNSIIICASSPCNEIPGSTLAVYEEVKLESGPYILKSAGVRPRSYMMGHFDRTG
jgi:hypothetical protein